MCDNMIKFKTFSYIDVGATDIEAFRMLIPNDWKFQGGIRWILDNPGMPAIVGFIAGSGVDEFEVFQNQPFFWTNVFGTLMIFPRGSRYFENPSNSSTP